MADIRFNPNADTDNALRIATVDETNVSAVLGTSLTVAKTSTHLCTHFVYKPYADADSVTVAIAGTPAVSALTATDLLTAIGAANLANDGGLTVTYGGGNLVIENVGSLVPVSVTTTAP